MILFSFQLFILVIRMIMSETLSFGEASSKEISSPTTQQCGESLAELWLSQLRLLLECRSSPFNQGRK